MPNALISPNMDSQSAAARRPQAAQSPANMNRLAKILPIENVVIDLSVTSKKRVFEQAGLMFENQNGIARSTVTDNLFARERLGSTGPAKASRFRTGASSQAPARRVRPARRCDPVRSPDGQPVGLLIFLLVPEQASSTSRSCRKSRNCCPIATRASVCTTKRISPSCIACSLSGNLELIRAEYFPVRGGTPPFRAAGAGPAWRRPSPRAHRPIGVTRVMDTSSINAQSIFDDNAATLKLSWLTGHEGWERGFRPTPSAMQPRAPTSSAT